MPATVTKENDLEVMAKETREEIATLKKSFGELMTKLEKTPASNQPDKWSVFGGSPHIRRGEDPMSSRPYSFMKALGLVTGELQPDEAKVESDFASRLHDVYVKSSGPGAGYQYGAKVGEVGRYKIMAPLCTSYMQEGVVPNSFRKEMREAASGWATADPEEMKWIRQKQWAAKGYDVKTLSWLNEFTGGSLVAPPEMGELIELLRNKEALVNAGARTVPLPPQGRLKYPRQTAASTAYWIGENAPITQSDIGTGEVTLQAKKLAVLIKSPNELIRFASPAAEQLMRDDMTKTLALGLDLAGLQGTGGDNVPLGLINRQNITTITSSRPTADGDYLVGQDMYRMIAAVEEANAEFEGFVMRPKTMYKLYQLRADAVSQGDQAGPYLFNLTRSMEDGTKATIATYPVTKSTQVNQAQTKGNGTGLTYIVGGMWSDMLIGMFGAIEFAATTMGDTPFVNDQTWVRGILSCDVQVRHEASFVLLSNLSTTLQ